MMQLAILLHIPKQMQQLTKLQRVMYISMIAKIN